MNESLNKNSETKQSRRSALKSLGARTLLAAGIAAQLVPGVQAAEAKVVAPVAKATAEAFNPTNHVEAQISTEVLAERTKQAKETAQKNLEVMAANASLEGRDQPTATPDAQGVSTITEMTSADLGGDDHSYGTYSVSSSPNGLVFETQSSSRFEGIARAHEYSITFSNAAAPAPSDLSIKSATEYIQDPATSFTGLDTNNYAVVYDINIGANGNISLDRDGHDTGVDAPIGGLAFNDVKDDPQLMGQFLSEQMPS